MNKTQANTRCEEASAPITTGMKIGKTQDQLIKDYKIEIDYKLQAIIDRKITMDFSWFQKKEIQESGFTLAQEYLFSLGMIESDKPELNYNIIRNPLAELDGYPGSSISFKGKFNRYPTKGIPRIKAQPFLLVPLELAIKIKALGYMP